MWRTAGWYVYLAGHCDQLLEPTLSGTVNSSAMVDQHDWKAKAERLDGFTIEVKQVLQQVLELGGVTKDLETGLVDFPGLVPQTAGPQPVNLCWRYGEEAVRFWHGFDEGYAQRKPLP